MPRDLRARENQLRAKAKREAALARKEFGLLTAPRTAAAGATSFALKVEDPEVRRLVAEYLERRR